MDQFENRESERTEPVSGQSTAPVTQWSPPAGMPQEQPPAQNTSRLIRGPKAGTTYGYIPPAAPAPVHSAEPVPRQEPAAQPMPSPEPPRPPVQPPQQVPSPQPVQPAAFPPPVYRQSAPQPQPRPVYTPEPPKKKGRVWKVLLCTVLILALVGGSCFATAWYMNRRWASETDEINNALSAQLAELKEKMEAAEAQKETEPSQPGDDATLPGTILPAGDAMTPAQVYSQNVQAVVAISSSVTTTYYGQPTSATSTGSGFIVTADGYIVTNYHVVEDAESISVTTNAGQVYDATYIGGDSNNDVAVLKVEATGLPTVTIGSSDALIVGDQVVAIGNPLGELTNTLTVGYVSAKDRAVTTDSFAINMIQTDAAINSGNSGGPLFNMYGQVIGITSAKYSGESSSGASIEGIGFAIPIDDVMDLIQSLIQNGVVTSGYMGVSVSDYVSSADYAAYYGISADAPTGAIVREVVDGYCAQAAGIQVNDIIVSMGKYTISGVTSLSRALRDYGAGDTVAITVYRDGKLLELTITLDERPADLDTTPQETPTGGTP